MFFEKYWRNREIGEKNSTWANQSCVPLVAPLWFSSYFGVSGQKLQNARLSTFTLPMTSKFRDSRLNPFWNSALILGVKSDPLTLEHPTWPRRKGRWSFWWLGFDRWKIWSSIRSRRSTDSTPWIGHSDLAHHQDPPPLVFRPSLTFEDNSFWANCRIYLGQTR